MRRGIPLFLALFLAMPVQAELLLQILEVDAKKYPDVRLDLRVQEGSSSVLGLREENLEVFVDGIFLAPGGPEGDSAGGWFTFQELEDRSRLLLRGGVTRGEGTRHSLTLALDWGGERTVRILDFAEAGGWLTRERQDASLIPVNLFTVSLVVLLVVGAGFLAAYLIRRLRRTGGDLGDCPDCGEPWESGFDRCPYCSSDEERLLGRLDRTVMITGAPGESDPESTPILRQVWWLRRFEAEIEKDAWFLGWEGPTLLGDDPGQGITLSGHGLSPVELRLQPEDDVVRLEALGQTGQVRVNGVTARKALLRSGDRLEVGPLWFRLDLELQPM